MINFKAERPLTFTEFRDAVEPWSGTITENNVFSRWAQFKLNDEIISVEDQAEIVQRMCDKEAEHQRESARHDPEDRSNVFGWGRRDE